MAEHMLLTRSIFVMFDEITMSRNFGLRRKQQNIRRLRRRRRFYDLII